MAEYLPEYFPVPVGKLKLSTMFLQFWNIRAISIVETYVRRIYRIVGFDRSYQLIESSSKVSFMQSSSRVWSADRDNRNIARNDSVEQESEFEPRCCVSFRRIRFAIELDPRSINNSWSHKPRTTEQWKVSCTVLDRDLVTGRHGCMSRVTACNYFIDQRPGNSKLNILPVSCFSRVSVKFTSHAN